MCLLQNHRKWGIKALTRLTGHLDLDMFYRNWLSLLNYAIYAIYASISVVVPVEFYFMKCRTDVFGFSLGLSCVADWIWRWGTGATCNFQLCLLNFTYVPADISGNKFCRRFPTSPSAINDHEGLLSKSRWRLSHVYFGKRKREKRKKTGIYFASGFISFASFLPDQRCPQSFFELVAQQSVSLLFA